VLVLGYGNTLRGDDGFGPAVASYLQGKVASAQSVEILSEQQLLPEHAEKVAAANLVIFVDACQSTEVGRIVCLEFARDSETKGSRAESILAHALSASTILELAASLYGHCPQAYVYTVGTASVGFSQTLSPLVEAAVPKVAEMILSKLGSFDRSR
jgi:hydrogenase maturation protease